jgi:coenzyme PQQ synthesis protein D (PqqD)
MVLQAHTKHALNRDVVFAELDTEAILLNTTTGIYFGLDDVATRVWALLDQDLTDEQIHAQILDEYAVDADELRADLRRILGQLEAHGLITRSIGD